MIAIGWVTGFGTDVFAQSPAETQRVILKMRDGVTPDPQGVFAGYRSMDAVKMTTLHALNIVIVEVPADWDLERLITTLTRDPAVAYGTPDQPTEMMTTRRPNDLNTGADPDVQWGLEGVRATDVDIGAPTAWFYTTGSTAVVIAVMDTGIDYTHPDLVDNLWVNTAELEGTKNADDENNGVADDIYGIDCINSDGDPWDDHNSNSIGHGTFISGIIAAQGNNGFGIVGVAWDARIMAVKALGQNGEGNLGSILCAMDYVLVMKRRGVNIRAINVSLGFDDPPSDMSSTLLRDSINQLASEDVVLVAAAGNEGDDLDAVAGTFSLAEVSTSDYVIGVASHNRNGSRSSFSNIGRTSVDLAAPGRGIYSTEPRQVNFGLAQIQNSNILFDNAETDSRNPPSFSSNFERLAAVSLPAAARSGDSAPTNGFVWHNTRSLQPISGIRYGPLDLSAFEASQEKLLLYFNRSFVRSTATESLLIRFADEFSATCSTKVIHAPRLSPSWQRSWVEIPPCFHGERNVRVEFLPLPSTPDLTLADVYLDDIGIGRVEDVDPDDSFRLSQGTSFSTPYVTGAIALLAAYRPDLNGVQLREIVLNNVRQTSTWETLVATGGILDLAAAVIAATTPAVTVTPTNVVLTEGERTTLMVSLSRVPGFNNTTDRVTIVFDGIPGISAFPSLLTFSTSNWHIPQAVNIAVAADGLLAERAATLSFSGGAGSDAAFLEAVTHINTVILNTDLGVSQVRLKPSIITPDEDFTATVQLNSPAFSTVSITLVLSAGNSPYRATMNGQIPVGDQQLAFSFPAPDVTLDEGRLLVQAQVGATFMEGGSLSVPMPALLRVVNGPLTRLRLRTYLEGALQ